MLSVRRFPFETRVQPDMTASTLTVKARVRIDWPPSSTLEYELDPNACQNEGAPGLNSWDSAPLSRELNS